MNPVVTYMKQYPQLDLDFLDDLDTVSHDVKKMPNVYVNELYRDFHESLLVYQKSHPRDLPLLYPIENLVENMSIEEKVAQLFVI